MLSTFRTELHTLFVQGYILCDPADTPPQANGLSSIAGPLVGTPKTITQLAMEQCVDMLTIQVGPPGGRQVEKCLWSRTSKEDCMGAMSEMKSIVGDVLARMDADFTNNSLYLCFEAFDLTEWARVLRLVHVPGEVEEASIRIAALKRKGRLLCEVLGVEWSFEKFALAVRAALRELRHVSPTLDKSVHNRVAWAQALALSEGSADQQSAANMEAGRAASLQDFEVPIRFYLSMRDGTGDVERGLGRLAAIQHCHQGAEETDISYAEACLELVLEGPQSENLWFTQSEGSNTLLLTPFSRSCSQLWLSLFKRRFGCQQQQRKDVGARRWGRLTGTMQAVKLFHVEATERLMAQARSDQAAENIHLDRATVVGLSRAAVANDKTAALEANKGIKSFRKTTEDRAKDKQQFRLWKGLAATPPKLRTAGAMVKSPNCSPARSKQIASARFALAQRKRKIAGASAATRGPVPTVGPAQLGGAASSSSSSSSSAPLKRQKLQVVGGMPPLPQPPMPKNPPQSNCKRQLVPGHGLSSRTLPQQQHRGAIASRFNTVLQKPVPQQRAPLPSLFVQYMQARGRATRLADQRAQAGTRVAVKKEHL